MNETELADKLRELPLIRSLPKEARESIASVLLRISTTAAYEDGESIIKERTRGGHDGYVLLEGDVVVERETNAPVTVAAPSLLGEMLQFNPRAQRTATVRARGKATALKFPWEEFYAEAKQCLSETDQDLLLESIERSVWERFGSDTIIELALFSGLPDTLKLRASLALQWMVQHRTLTDGELLFAQGDICGAIGYVIVEGAVRLVRANYPPRIIEAPNVIGVMPRFEPGLQWSATATAKGDVQLLRFSWQEFTATLERRLTQQESEQFWHAIDANSPAHFMH